MVKPVLKRADVNIFVRMGRPQRRQVSRYHFFPLPVFTLFVKENDGKQKWIWCGISRIFRKMTSFFASPTLLIKYSQVWKSKDISLLAILANSSSRLQLIPIFLIIKIDSCNRNNLIDRKIIFLAANC